MKGPLLILVIILMAISLGCGNGIHPIDDDLLPKNLLPDTDVTTLADETGAIPLTEDGLLTTQNSTTNSTSINLFGTQASSTFSNTGSGIATAGTEPSFSPKYSTYLKVESFSKSESLNGNVYDKLLSDRIADTLSVGLTTFSSRFVQLAGSFQRDNSEPSSQSGVSLPNSPISNAGSTPTLQSTTTSTGSTFQNFPSTTTSSSSSTSTTGGFTSNSNGSQGVDPQKILLTAPPALLIRALIASQTAIEIENGSSTSSLTNLVNPTGQNQPQTPFGNELFSAQFSAGVLSLNSDSGREIKVQKVKETLASDGLKIYISDGKCDYSWDLLGDNPKGIEILGATSEWVFSASGTLLSNRFQFQNQVSLIGKQLLTGKTLEIQGLGYLVDSKNALEQWTISPECTLNYGEPGVGVIRVKLQGVNGQIQTTGNQKVHQLSFAPKVLLTLTDVFLPKETFFLPEWLSGLNLESSQITLSFYNMFYSSHESILQGFQFDSFDADIDFKLSDSHSFFGGDPLKRLVIKTTVPLKLIERSIKNPVSGRIQGSFTYSDGQIQDFILTPQNGKYQFQGRLRAADGGEFEIERSSDTKLKGQIAFSGGLNLNLSLQFPQLNPENVILRGEFLNQSGEKELGIEASQDKKSGTVSGFWSQFKPIFKQGRFEGALASEVQVLDANDLPLARFKLN